MSIGAEMVRRMIQQYQDQNPPPPPTRPLDDFEVGPTIEEINREGYSLAEGGDNDE